MKSIKIIQNVDLCIQVMCSASKYMQESGFHVNKWWDLKNLNKEFLFQYAKPEEFYCVLYDDKPAAAVILQICQNAQDWKTVDKGTEANALYIHWLCVDHEFSGMNLPGIIIDSAEQKAKEKNIERLRADTSADEIKLRKLYEDLGFKLVGEIQEDYRKTALFEKKVKIS